MKTGIPESLNSFIDPNLVKDLCAPFEPGFVARPASQPTQKQIEEEEAYLEQKAVESFLRSRRTKGAEI